MPERMEIASVFEERGFRYLPGFLDERQAAALFEWLLHGLDWRQEWLYLYGRRTPVPRLLSWSGDAGLNYRYSGTDHVCDGWQPALLALRRRLASALGMPSNFVLINRYRHGGDYMGWHADDERGLASTVASVSLGATRRFLLRPPGWQSSERLDLENGSVLLMDGSVRHSLPRTRRAVGERINLTFRHIENASSS